MHNNHNVSYSIIRYFIDTILDTHKKVFLHTRERDILFKITLTDNTELKVVLINEYCITCSKIHELIKEFGKMDIIVTGGAWNGYSKEAKYLGYDLNIGIFNISEFRGCLFFKKWINYSQKDEKGKPIYAYKTA